MRDRAFLSWVTGYSAFAAALGLLYVTAKEGASAASRSATPDYTMRAEGPLNLSSPDLANFGMYEEKPLQGAVDVMTVVGRQFPRLVEYKTVVTQLHDLLLQRAPLQGGKDHQMVENMHCGASPDHLQRLISLISRMAITLEQ